MIHDVEGNLIEADAEALVNTVNCVGFMGKGIALQFKKAYPENFDAYHKACAAGEVRPGRMFIFDFLMAEGRSPMAYRTWRQAADWAVLAEAAERGVADGSRGI